MKKIWLVALILLLVPFVAFSKTPTDLPADHWAAEAIQDLLDKGILIGYPDGSFLGEQPISRNEAMTAVERARIFWAGQAEIRDLATKEDIQSLREKLESLLAEFRTLIQDVQSLDRLLQTESDALRGLDERVRILEE